MSNVGFINLTPALRAETERGVLTYNGPLDTHLNRRGATVVATSLALTLRDGPKQDLLAGIMLLRWSEARLRVQLMTAAKIHV